MVYSKEMWTVKGATLSDKNAMKEYGLTKEQIFNAMREGKLQYKEGNMHGNPWFRLLRHEVEELVNELFSEDYLEEKKLRTELASVKKELRSIAKRKKELEKRAAQLTEELEKE